QASLANQPLLIAAALVAVYIVLGVLYESYVHPLTILSTLPSAGVGAILALLACRTELTVIALIGILLLIGIVKKNAIMMIDVALGTGCAVGPDYARPTVITPDAYKEVDGWKVARPRDDAARGSWWEVFGDPDLARLEAQVSVSNQNLVVAEATYRQARALVREARSALFPQITTGIGYTRSRDSATLGTSATSRGAASTGRERSNFQLPIDVAWELDLWGRIRRTVESNRAGAQASAGDLAA